MSSENQTFSLPAVGAQGTSTPGVQSPTQSAPAQTQNGVKIQPTSAALVIHTESGPSTKGYIIGGAIFVILAVLFFFVARLFSDSLVSKKRSPNSANHAAIWLFLVLLDLAAAAIVGVLDVGLLSSMSIAIPLGVVGLVGILLLIFSLRGK